MENLFGEIPLVKLLLAFAIVFILIVATFWLLRRFGGTRIGGSSRGRLSSLAAGFYFASQILIASTITLAIRGQRCKKRPHESPTLAYSLLSLFFC